MLQLPQPPKPTVIYPDSDGRAMADNTKQFRWIVVIQQNLEWWFAADPNVFVAGDLLWYPVEGNNKIRMAPDVMVVLGRPKGDRGSYRQWEEDNLPPQVVFEILSPGNTRAEMNHKLLFYDRFGVEEYYLYDPDQHELSGWLRREEFLDVIDPIDNWVSPRLQIRFEMGASDLHIFRPDGQPFLTYVEIARQVEQERQRAEQERQRAEQERQRAEQAEAKAKRLADRLRQMGIDADQV
ncbi:Uma2 family endonuclease [Trichothermofontia sichuanensis B231]|uniref:Uma2 family endonuclease n=1 Tax=Trichothermofontia sichuanensis TaxID=3045816 RepID=UPI002246EBAD|nr:Uma2 family endonuclease [Trichothermofontia sichuanensis]UZQ55980.1 Uma2 family endonuclease [Trichothermofontia sichuanensis B231]